MLNRIFGRFAVMSLLALGAGCGGTELEEVQTDAMESVAQAAEEEPRKVEDMIGAIDRDENVLYAQEGSERIVLDQLKAQDTGRGTYVTKDELSGEEWTYALKPVPIRLWPTFFKLCSNGQWIRSTQTCPKLFLSGQLIRVWSRASCSFRVQAASTSACTNVSGGSYNIQYQEVYKCGVGTGFCVERPAITAIRYNFNVSACVMPYVSSVQGLNTNYRCR